MKNLDVLRCDDMNDELMSETMRPSALSLSHKNCVLEEKRLQSEVFCFILWFKRLIIFYNMLLFSW